MKFWIDEETGEKLCESNCVDEWLFDIWAVSVDYDRCNNIEDLKNLIDEIVEMSQKARACLWDDKLFGIHGKPQDNE